MTVYETLTLAFLFAALIVEILKFNQKNNHLLTLTG